MPSDPPTYAEIVKAHEKLIAIKQPESPFVVDALGRLCIKIPSEMVSQVFGIKKGDENV